MEQALLMIALRADAEWRDRARSLATSESRSWRDGVSFLVVLSKGGKKKKRWSKL